MQEEDFIRQITEGADNPFRVPEGYFDSLTDRVMSQLPARKRNVFSLRYVWRYAAVLLVAFGVGLTFLLHSRHEQRLAESDIELEYQEDYIDDVFDYAMISSSDIELYLTEAQ
ncbi:MAG: hypothetical protein LUI09_01080 [Prevotellaceae bacterium]|nr:hypothetical protein [Prevotellaceae bacterium]